MVLYDMLWFSIGAQKERRGSQETADRDTERFLLESLV
jgi:hypothetical protein